MLVIFHLNPFLLLLWSILLSPSFLPVEVQECQGVVYLATTTEYEKVLDVSGWETSCSTPLIGIRRHLYAIQ